jgi:hypothetical protein
LSFAAKETRNTELDITRRSNAGDLPQQKPRRSEARHQWIQLDAVVLSWSIFHADIPPLFLSQPCVAAKMLEILLEHSYEERGLVFNGFREGRSVQHEDRANPRAEIVYSARARALLVLHDVALSG